MTKGTTKKSPEQRCFVIFVAYYPKYLKESIHRLKRIVRRLNYNENTILVVFNNELSDTKMMQANNDYHYIVGSNTSWEFSAWDEGIDYLKSDFQIQNEDIVIFANDTFCHHRVFTRFDEFCFEYSIKRYVKSNTVVGHIDYSPQAFKVKGEKVDKWLSTFLFAAKYKVIRNTLPFSQCQINDIELKDKKISVSQSCNYFNEYLTSWLLNGWYKSGALSDESIVKKAQAIVNEKSFSGRLISNNTQIKSIYSSRLMRYIRKIQVRVGCFLR